MTVTVTMTFDSPAQAAEWLSGKAPSPTAAPSTSKPAASARTAEAAPAAAPATKELDFDKDVVPVMQAFAKRDKAGFGELMKKYGFTKAADVKAKAETWGEIVAACAA